MQVEGIDHMSGIYNADVRTVMPSTISSLTLKAEPFQKSWLLQQYYFCPRRKAGTGATIPSLPSLDSTSDPSK
jgi:hypothetical protein